MVKAISIGVLLISGYLAYIAVADDYNCEKSEELVDKCGLKLALVGDREVVIPSNDAEMTAHCTTMFDNLKCIRQFVNHCLATFPKTIFGMFSFDLKKELKKRCESPDGRAEFMKHMSCLHAKDKLEPMFTCKDNYVGQLEWILKNVKKEDQTTAACCAFHQTHQCFREKIEEICHPITGSGTKDYIDEVIASTVTEAIDYACGKYKSLDQCHEFLDKTIWEPLFEVGKDAKAAGFEPHHRSSLSATIQLLNQYDN